MNLTFNTFQSQSKLSPQSSHELRSCFSLSCWWNPPAASEPSTCWKLRDQNNQSEDEVQQPGAELSDQHAAAGFILQLTLRGWIYSLWLHPPTPPPLCGSWTRSLESDQSLTRTPDEFESSSTCPILPPSGLTSDQINHHDVVFWRCNDLCSL